MSGIDSNIGFLFVLTLTAFAIGAEVGGAAFTDRDEIADAQVYLQPADTPNGAVYADFDEDGELVIQIGSINSKTLTIVDDLFVIGVADVEGSADSARVWIDHDANRVTFYHMDTREPIDSKSDAVELEEDESIVVGLVIDSDGAEVLLENVTVRAEIGEVEDDDSTSSPGELIVEVEVDGETETITIENADGGAVIETGLERTDVMTETGVALNWTAIELDRDGDATFEIDTRARPTKSTAAETTPLFAYSVSTDVENDDLRSVVFRIHVDRELIDADEQPATPRAVGMLYLPSGADEWEPVEIELVHETADAYVYEIETDDFSEFAVVVDDPAFESTGLVANPTTVEPGEVVFLAGTVENTGAGEGETTADLRVDGEIVANRTVVLAPGEMTYVGTELTFDEPGTYDLELGNETIEVTVAEDPDPIPGPTPERTYGARPEPQLSPDEIAERAASDDPESTTTPTEPAPDSTPIPVLSLVAVLAIVLLSVSIALAVLWLKWDKSLQRE